ncbi:putative carboxyl methyl esterase [Claviceps digitariae]|nr:putative carboxyl methyl esterase [Claviceps digitariae]
MFEISKEESRSHPVAPFPPDITNHVLHQFAVTRSQSPGHESYYMPLDSSPHRTQPNDTPQTSAFTMSHLQREWAKSKLGLASQPVMEEPEEEQEQNDEPLADLAEHIDDDSSSASSVSSTGTIIPTPSQKLLARPQGVARGRTLEPVPWTTYFERELYLESDELPGLRFHAYLTSPVGKGPLFVAHHGAGSSGLSFAVVSSEIRKRLPTAGILAVDCRGHGSTVSPEGSELDLRLATLAGDLHFVVRATKAQMGWPEVPPVILVGHSLGGAVVAELAHTGTLGTSLLGYALLDIVEGSAMDALQSMHAYLSTRPGGFASVETAIDWHVRSRTLRNSISARTSVPALLRLDETVDASQPWRWRTDLATTQAFWQDWFTGLSKKFLGAKGGKLLLLAGTDRLDTEMTIGQMQGKYALQVFADAGHFIHEDVPEQTAVSLCEFYRRNDRSLLVLPPKVSDLLKQGKRV